MDSKIFNVKVAGLTLPFEFYTLEYIEEDLKKTFGDCQVRRYDMSIYRKWSKIRKDKDGETRFFTYIKFFVEKETNITYGLIGGKTNYNNPDISLRDEKDNERRFGRLFVQGGQYDMSNEIIVIHHKKTDEDSMQSFFIERYVQRKWSYVKI